MLELAPSPEKQLVLTGCSKAQPRFTCMWTWQFSTSFSWLPLAPMKKPSTLSLLRSRPLFSLPLFLGTLMSSHRSAVSPGVKLPRLKCALHSRYSLIGSKWPCQHTSLAPTRQHNSLAHWSVVSWLKCHKRQLSSRWHSKIVYCAIQQDSIMCCCHLTNCGLARTEPDAVSKISDSGSRLVQKQHAQGHE